MRFCFIIMIGNITEANFLIAGMLGATCIAHVVQALGFQLFQRIGNFAIICRRDFMIDPGSITIHVTRAAAPITIDGFARKFILEPAVAFARFAAFDVHFIYLSIKELIQAFSTQQKR